MVECNKISDFVLLLAFKYCIQCIHTRRSSISSINHPGDYPSLSHGFIATGLSTILSEGFLAGVLNLQQLKKLRKWDHSIHSRPHQGKRMAFIYPGI